MNTSQIPPLSEKSFEGMKSWFSVMLGHGLLFHPDDRPEDIIRIDSGEKTFSKNECFELNSIINEFFAAFGDDVYEAAYPSFIKAFEKH